MHTPIDVEIHIQLHGFDVSYTNWKHHGEELPPPVVHNTTNELRDFLYDVQGEIVTEPVDAATRAPPATSNDKTDAEKNRGLDDLIADTQTELWPGCDWMSSLDFLARLSHIKVLNKWTNTSMDQLLELLQISHPKNNTIPSSYYETKKWMKTIGLGYDAIHACKNDCCLFWKEHEMKQSCPICGESRWKLDTKGKGKQVAQKILRYFPITPRLKRLYSSRHTAKDMTWHATGQCKEDGKMRHPVDGLAWKNFDKMHPKFAEEKRNVRLGLAADGFNPFGNLSTTYSMWPVILTTYNTPPWICMKESSLMLTMLIPGPKSPGKDFDVYMRPLVDELKTLWSKGVLTKDAATNTYFTMKAMLLWTINDFPARSSLSGWSGQGYKACPTCNEDTPSTRVIGKQAFVGHRRFLPPNDPLRSSLEFNNQIEEAEKPRKFTADMITQQLEQLRPIGNPGKNHSNVGVKRKRGQKDKLPHNWTKISIFRQLEYWRQLPLQHNLDVMHIEKNVLESLLGTLLVNEKSKDTHNARIDLKKLGIRKDLWLIPKDASKEDGPCTKPHPKFSFTPKDRERFCRFIKGVKLPDGFGSNWKQKVTDNDTNITGMKSHDCHIMMQRLLPVGVRGLLDPSISTPIIELCAFFKQICARELMVQDMKKAQKQLIKLLCTFELIYPPAFFDIMIHLVIHLPQEAIYGGPVYMRWMYPIERYMKKLKNYVRNKAKPEGCIAEGYIADEALTACSRSLQDVQTRFNRRDRFEDAPWRPCDLHVFQSVCKFVSRGVHKRLTLELMVNLHWYVLDNCTDIDEYKNEFTMENPGIDLKTNFPNWFGNKKRQMRVDDDSTCSDELLSLANGLVGTARYYTACNVNSVRFVCHNRDERRTTQNSGVSTPGVDGFTFYGQLEDIIDLHYSCAYNVVLLRCRWFNTLNQGKTLRCIKKNNMTSIHTQYEWYKEDQHILATQARQVFYLNDMSEKSSHWKVVQEVNHRKHWDKDIIEGHVVDVVHDVSSSDVRLDANLDSLSYPTLSVPGESSSVQVTLTSNDIDLIDDDDPDIVPHVISDSDSEDVDPDDNEQDPLPSNEAYSSDDPDY